MGLITLSAAYGAGGSWLGSQLAQRLNVPLHDRVISVAVAEQLDMRVEEVVAAEASAPSGFARFYAALAAAAGPWGVIPEEAVQDLTFEQEYPRRAAEEIRRLADSGEGVFLGRGAAAVLRDDARALHVRVDGPRERRIAQAMKLKNIDRETAEREQQQTDGARETYVRRFLNVEPHDPRLYHLVIDSTTIPLEACADLIISAARAHSADRATRPKPPEKRAVITAPQDFPGG